MKAQLKAFGFSEKEADIYLSLVSLGSSRATDIAKRAGINRSTAYVILDALMNRGLVTISEERGVKRYGPMPPERLTAYLENQASQYASFARDAKKLVPELKSLQKKNKKENVQPKVQLIEGDQGMKTVYEDTLSSLETIRAYASVEHVEKAKKEARVQVIFPNTPEAKSQLAHSKNEAEEAYRLPSGKYGFSSEINIYDNKVIFISPEEKFGLIIESPEFARTLKTAFVSAKKEAGKIRKHSVLDISKAHS